jgi:hypothetical protein
MAWEALLTWLDESRIFQHEQKCRSKLHGLRFNLLAANAASLLILCIHHSLHAVIISRNVRTIDGFGRFPFPPRHTIRLRFYVVQHVSDHSNPAFLFLFSTRRRPATSLYRSRTGQLRHVEKLFCIALRLTQLGFKFLTEGDKKGQNERGQCFVAIYQQECQSLRIRGIPQCPSISTARSTGDKENLTTGNPRVGRQSRARTLSAGLRLGFGS